MQFYHIRHTTTVMHVFGTARASTQSRQTVASFYTGTNCLLVPPVKLSAVGSRAFPVAGPKTWNSLPDITSSQFEYTFRRQAPAQIVAFQEVFSGHHYLILTAS